ncbi:MAG: DUF4154 domain-containing protein [Ignavibacteriales bacterium]|nr:DUF4154 domain-containing protein [Ignavibacteriales bacterium]
MSKLIHIQLFLIFFFQVLFSQSVEVPVDIQFPIFLKILTFDRKLQQRGKNGLSMMILYQKNYKPSYSIREEINKLLNQLAINRIESIPIKYNFVDIDEVNLHAALIKYHTNLIYICPLRGVALQTITQTTKELGVLSFTGVPEYVEEGVSVGIELKGEKPHIMINITSAKAEQAEFSSQLLRVSKILE